jgi:glycosyltransferase involved in cell wall biosynthesis
MALILLIVHAAILVLLLFNLRYLRHRRPSGSAPLPRLSVLIPARNEADNLRRLLPSLLAQDHPAFEIIVYDDASEDDTWAVIQSHEGPRLRALRGTGPPPGWIGKVHALHQAAGEASGERLLFLDADTALNDTGALRRIAERFEALPPGSVLTALPTLLGGGLLLVSLVPNAILGGLPWPLVRRFRLPALGALNGQCWMIDGEAYRRLSPHEHVRNAILEGVQIGRYLKRCGLTPVLCDLRDELSVYMYRNLTEAWMGFRKNAYLILGGHPVVFLPLFALFTLTYVLAPFFAPPLLLSLYAIKFTTDRLMRFPLWVTLAAPLCFLCGALLQFDSFLAHLTRRVAWKGRPVGW